MHRLMLLALCVLAGACASVGEAGPARQTERLDRGAVAGPAEGGGALVSWRILAHDPRAAAFDVYRHGRRLNAAPVRGASNFVDAAGGGDFSGYSVRLRGSAPEAAIAAAQGYLSIPLTPPDGGVTPDGVAYTYSANDGAAGDLDGDGRYEIVLKWDPSNSKDNAFHGYTGNVFIDAYTLAGERLWRIDMGRNIRAGAHYTQFLVYDFDGDGRAEVVARTSDGTRDGAGVVIGDADADWRGGEGETPQADRTGAVTRDDGVRVAPLAGRIVRGPEYLTVFEGATGRALASALYAPQRGADTHSPSEEERQALWGDAYANRSDRFLAGVAHLDGAAPSIVMARGYYARSVLAAWDWRGGALTQRWVFDSNAPGNEGYGGQGNHQLSVADVDGDGRDEIVYGAMTVDDDGTALWNSNLRHGDALHVSDLDPTRPGLERFGVHEDVARNGGVGLAMLDARTGAVLWTAPATEDVGRGLAIDIDPRHAGTEVWAWESDNIYNARGVLIGTKRPQQVNFGVWWDGDLLRELLDRNEISKWNWEAETTSPLLVAEGMAANNGTKQTPVLSADILGDWREEVVWRAEDSSELRVYVTPYPSEYGMVTLMHDPTYRLSVAWQNVAYNQPPHAGFFIGEGMDAGLRTK